MGVNNPDTLAKWIYYGTGNFLGANSNVGITYDFAPSGNWLPTVVDSAYGWFDTVRVKRHYWANKTVIGPSVGTANTWSSTDQLKVLGNLATTDSMRLGKASPIGDSTGMDWVLRQRTDGALFRINASDMAAFFSGGTGGLDDVLAVGQVLTTDRSSDGGAFTWLHTAAPTTSYSFNVYNTAPVASGGAFNAFATGTNSEAIFAQSMKFYGVRGKTFSSSATAAGRFEKDNSTANSVEPVLDLTRIVESAIATPGATGIGGAIDMYLENDNDDEIVKSNRVIWKYTDATNGSEDSEFQFWGLVNGVMTQFGALGSGGFGGTQGLQDVITVDPVLTTNNTITNGANILTLTGTDAGLTSADGVLIVNNTTTPAANNAIVATATGTNSRGFSGYAVDGVGVYGEGAGGVFGLGLSTGVGVYGQSTDGPGGLFTSTSTVGATFFTNPTSTATSAPIITLTRSTSGTAANGLAGRIDFNMENAAGTAVNTNRLITRYTDVTAGSEDTEIDLYGLVNGVMTLYGTFNATGLAGGGSGTVNTGTANTLAYYPASTAAVDDLAAITANRALISDANGLPTHSATTATELGHVSGVTSAIQTQLNGKATLALDNLASVQTNADIIPAADNARDMGSSTKAFRDYYGYSLKLKGSTSGTITVAADALGNAISSTVLSGTGYIPTCFETRLTGDFTGSNVNTVQPMFDPAQDVLTVQGSTAYEFEILLMLTHGAASHSLGISFELGGGASLTSITYTSLHWATAINTQTASQTTNVVQVATNTAINAALANAQEQTIIKGTINVNAGGTITPSYTFSTAPGGTVLTKSGSYMKICPKGTNTYQVIGPFN